MWPNAVLTHSHPLGVHIVCWGYLWIPRNVNNMFLKVSTTIDVIPRSPFNSHNYIDILVEVYIIMHIL